MSRRLTHCWDCSFVSPQAFCLPESDFLSLAAIVAVINLLYASLGCIVLSLPNCKELIMGQTFLGFLIGAGLGIGFEIAALLKAKLPARHA